ncbi:helix-turn-helix domain-containing protein [Morganella psychrotolerans]|uniref:helix-turn-helix domain-containing protein n=1 Tax=Morganella psychrotolerans TaxID=368603 RepID=UPI0039B0E125
MSNYDESGSQKKEQKTSPANWHRADILAAIKKKGATLAQLSRENGLHERTLYNALERHWPKGERIISEFLDIPPHIIWPERYQ